MSGSRIVTGSLLPPPLLGLTFWRVYTAYFSPRAYNPRFKRKMLRRRTGWLMVGWGGAGGVGSLANLMNETLRPFSRTIIQTAF